MKKLIPMELHRANIKYDLWKEIEQGNVNFIIAEDEGKILVGDLITFDAYIDKILILATDKIFKITYKSNNLSGLKEGYIILGLKELK